MTRLQRRKGVILIYAFLLMASSAEAQRVIVNSTGEKIIMYPDGSWRPAEPGDSLLIRQYLEKSGTPATGSSSETMPAQRNQAEEEEFLIRQWNDLYAILVAEEKKVQNEFRAATNAQFKASEKLETAEANKQLIGPGKLDALQREFDLSVKNLRQAKLKQKDFKSLMEKTNKANQSPSTLSQKKINQVKSGYSIYLANHEPYRKDSIKLTPENPSPPVMTSELQNPSAPVTALSTSPELEPFNPSMQNVLPSHMKSKSYMAEPFKCGFVTDTIDTATGMRKLVLRPHLLFTHTDPDLRPYFKEKELITCRSQVFQVGPYLYLNLYFQIASSHVQSNFGSLDNGSMLRLRLMDGEYLSLYNIKTDQGKIDPYSGNTLFSAQYALGKSEIKKLRSAGLDKIRVMWSTGFEDYDVFMIDVIKNQLDCLSSVK